MVYPTLLPLVRTSRLSVVDWTDAPADLNGLVRFAERRNLVSAHVPSRFKRSLQRQQYHLSACSCWPRWTDAGSRCTQRSDIQVGCTNHSGSPYMCCCYGNYSHITYRTSACTSQRTLSASIRNKNLFIFLMGITVIRSVRKIARSEY